ncbi:nuclear transport factor 2 family protein [Arthrobacter sp. NPDC056886]|uniref:nuclear transport factor 2 family protein n=1 Tax=Arthrobacter sp. NPDC056886 TaxID=3345960 RepID=UPI0036709AB9
MTSIQETKAVVDAYYQAGVEGHLPTFGEYLHDDFVVTAPNYLPWGGAHIGAQFFREQVLEHLSETLDFSRFSYEGFTAEGTNAVALINIGVVGTDDLVKISEHWEVVDGKARSLWVAYFEPQPLLKHLGITVSAAA